MTPEEAAVAVAARFGLTSVEAVVLSNSNNVVIWLRPSPLVAKVAGQRRSGLGLELAVAQHLVARGAPIVGPSGPLQEVHRIEDFELTFWENFPGDHREPSPTNVAHSLLQVHEALLSYPGRLPPFGDELSMVATALDDGPRIPALRTDDRLLLSLALKKFSTRVERRKFEQRALHGSPHSGNILARKGDVRFIDFETACVGPLEWDLAHVGDDVIAAYPGHMDRGLLADCRALASVKTATWCWEKFEHPDLKWHARHHLRVIKSLMGSTRGP